MLYTKIGFTLYKIIHFLINLLDPVFNIKYIFIYYSVDVDTL